MSRKLLYFIIFIACVFTLSIIWWILPTRPIFKAAGINVGMLVTGPPAPYKPPLNLTFEPNGKVIFDGTYWHPESVYLYFREDIDQDVLYTVAIPFDDFWSYSQNFAPGNYSVQVRIIDNLSRWSLYSDKVFFSIPAPPIPPEPPSPPVQPPNPPVTPPPTTETTTTTTETPPGEETKREEAPEGPESWLEKVAKIVNKNKAMIAIAIAVTATLAAMNLLISFVVMLATQLSLRTYILLIINYFLSLFKRKQKEKRGIVYDRATGRPVQGVLVSVFRVPQMRQIASSITDEEGSFMFVVDRGDYAVQVKKDGYVFPAKINRTVADYEGVYIGQTIHVSERSDVINVKIPIDVQEVSLMRSSKLGYVAKLYRLSDIVRIILLIFGSIVSVLILSYYQSLINYILATSYVVLWIVELRITSDKVKFSRVLDADGKKSIDLALVRTVSPEGKLTQTYVTDVLGRFLPYVPSPEHFISIRKPGYQETGFRPGSKRLVEGKKFYLIKLKAQNPNDNS